MSLTSLSNAHEAQVLGADMFFEGATEAEEVNVGFGRWAWNRANGAWTLSAGAARLLGVEGGWHADAQGWMTRVVAQDRACLQETLAQPSSAHTAPAAWSGAEEFRLIHPLDGLRWVRLLCLNGDARTPVLRGVLLDTTTTRLAEMRERFCFESTQLLIGTQTVAEAVTRVIELVCENLGWDCGAYWSVGRADMDDARLHCQHAWAQPNAAVESFIRQTRQCSFAAGECLVGEVWSSMQPAWIDDVQMSSGFTRAAAARAVGLRSGYAFPVSTVGVDGRRQSHGVLEFFSCQSRQREAQLPSLAATIGALIAQTVHRLEHQELIRHLALMDDLTGLANRKHFQQLLDAACLQNGATGEQFAVLYIDLDRFKPINDAFGHDAGNGVLRDFAQRLRDLLPPGAHAGRLGGDEFAILWAPSGTSAELQALGERVLLAARTPFLHEGRELSVSASVGISRYPEGGWTGPELMRTADAALYRSKQSGRNTLHVHEGDSQQSRQKQRSALADQITMEGELHQALLRNEFFLEYQPIFNVESDTIAAVEALIRWRRPNGDLVRPDVFIPVAEQSRLIVQIGRWVVRQACADLVVLQQHGYSDLQLNVNMAALEFLNAGLPAELCEVLEQHGLPARSLCLELTESMVMKQPEKAIPVMMALRQKGFQISLDDFGTGHSSLARLKNLPISSLKVDRSFVSGLPYGRDDSAIVRAVLDLGRRMNLHVIAEGVESEAQLLFLHQFGCRFIQGYALARPQSLNHLLTRPRPGALEASV